MNLGNGKIESSPLELATSLSHIQRHNNNFNRNNNNAIRQQNYPRLPSNKNNSNYNNNRNNNFTHLPAISVGPVIGQDKGPMNVIQN